MLRFLRLFCSALIWVSVVSLPVQAQPSLSHEQIRQARHKGEIKSLRWVLEQIQPQYPGRIIDVDLEHKHGLYIYKIKILQRGGYINKLYIDANTAEILKVKGRQRHKRKP